jgi:hypothetical protein
MPALGNAAFTFSDTCIPTKVCSAVINPVFLFIIFQLDVLHKSD